MHKHSSHNNIMLILSILPILASGAVAVWILRTVYGALFSSLSRVPGPFTARFTDLWYANRIYRGHFELDNIALHDKYGMKESSLALSSTC